MQYIIGLGIGAIICYFLIIGGVLVWPLVNLFAYLKVLIFPSDVRKKYGTNLDEIDFSQEISEEDKRKVKDITSTIKNYNSDLKNTLLQIDKTLSKLNSDFNALNPYSLPKNKDGSFSQRSNAGKEATKLQDSIYYQNSRRTKEVNKVSRNIKSCEKDIINIFNKPWNVWNQWGQRLARYNCNKHSIIFMVIGFPVFFFVLASFNFLGLQFPTFINVAEIYVYNVFVGPVLQFFDIEIFKSGMFSFLVSYDYALLLNKYYDKTFTFSNWLITALPMPILTFIVMSVSYSLQFDRAKQIQPMKYKKLLEVYNDIDKYFLEDS